MTLDSSRPQIEESWAPQYGAQGGQIPVGRWVDLTGRTRHGVSIQRGRQYELDTMQSGEYSVTLDNTDGALDPLNSAGPWYGSIRPYQPYRRRLQFSPKVNLLPQQIAACGEGWANGYNPQSGDISVFSDADPTGGIVAVLGAGVAYEETSVFQYAIPAATDNQTLVSYTDRFAVAPGMTYTFSMWVRNITPGTTVTIAPCFGIYAGAPVGVQAMQWASASTTVLTGSASAAWTRVTVTGTAPANTFGGVIGLSLAASPAANCTVQVDAWQFEEGSTASPWVYPGYWYAIFSGFVERWSSQYADGGTRGEVVPTAVDAFALLAQQTLDDAMTEEMNLYSPRFVYPLNDPAGSTVFADATGQNPPLPIGTAKTGAGVVTAGTAITAANLATGVFASDDTVLHLANSNPGTATNTGGASFLQLDAAGIKGPAAFKGGNWTRMFAFRYTGATPTSGNLANIWGLTYTFVGPYFNIGIDSNKNLSWVINTGADGFQQADSSGSGITAGDGNWHLVHIAATPADTVNETPATFEVYLDGVDVGGCYVGWLGTSSDVFGCSLAAPSANVASNNYAGDLALLAEFPSTLSANNIYGMYQVWRKLAAGESTGSRYARILRYAGYGGGTWLDTGNTLSMGPASDLPGTDALTALQAVVDTESGAHWVQGSGTIRFRARSGRYNATTPILTFGDGPGEIPYEDLQLDYDPTHLANLVQVTQLSTGQVFTAYDALSTANYAPRPMTRTVNTTNALECQDAANYLLSRYANPLPRVTSMKVNMGGMSQWWGPVLGVELGARIRVMRRPMGAPPIQLDVFIEQISWDFDDQAGAILTIGANPVDGTPYGTFASWRSTLYGSTPNPVGTFGFAVGPMGGNNSQALAAAIGPGQRVVIEPGTPNAETFTVSAIGATTPGSWAYGVINMTAASTLVHPAGAVICEALPGSTTNPATWDVSSALDSTNFAY